jgi:hypothetical protein
MVIYGVYIVSKSGGLIFNHDHNTPKIETEKTFSFPLDIKLLYENKKVVVAFGQRDGIMGIFKICFDKNKCLPYNGTKQTSFICKVKHKFQYFSGVPFRLSYEEILGYGTGVVSVAYSKMTRFCIKKYTLRTSTTFSTTTTLCTM